MRRFIPYNKKLLNLLVNDQPGNQPYEKIERNNFGYVEFLVHALGGTIEYMVPNNESVESPLGLYLESIVNIPETEQQTVKRFLFSDLFSGFNNRLAGIEMEKTKKESPEYIRGYELGQIVISAVNAVTKDITSSFYSLQKK
ncbi:MAG: hypothetical protein AABW92_00165 [Nanoarchaeota archaeon]